MPVLTRSPTCRLTVSRISPRVDRCIIHGAQYCDPRSRSSRKVSVNHENSKGRTRDAHGIVENRESSRRNHPPPHGFWIFAGSRSAAWSVRWKSCRSTEDVGWKQRVPFQQFIHCRSRRSFPAEFRKIDERGSFDRMIAAIQYYFKKIRCKAWARRALLGKRRSRSNLESSRLNLKKKEEQGCGAMARIQRDDFRTVRLNVNVNR